MANRDFIGEHGETRIDGRDGLSSGLLDVTI